MNSRPIPIAIALGSNQGDRHAHLAYALQRLTETFGPLTPSSIRETTPVEVPVEQSPFLNMAVVTATALSVGDTLEQLLTIERERGRERPFAGAPRTLDLDLILYGEVAIDRPGIVVPHPRFRTRLFVLEPLCEVAPEMLDPISGLTIAALLKELRSRP